MVSAENRTLLTSLTSSGPIPIPTIALHAGRIKFSLIVCAFFDRPINFATS